MEETLETLPPPSRQSPLDRVLRAVEPLDRRHLLWLAGIIAVSVLLRIATWNGVADGAHGRFIKTAVFGGVAAAVVWLLIRIQTDARSRLPLVCAAAVLLSGDAVHYVRLLNPITRGGPVLSLAASFPDEAAARRQWDFETTGGGSVRVDSGALRLESPPNATAYVVARLGKLPDVYVNWWLPVGLAERERVERLSWKASVNRTGGFYVMTELRRLLIQIVGYGVHVTYPDAQNVQRGFEIQHSAGTDGRPHDWELTRDTQQISLSIDGKQVWSAPQREDFGGVKFGETKVDSAHGGSMRLESVSYAARLDRR